MKKLFFLSFLFLSLSAQSIVDGIAFKVNNYPVTMYELQSLQKSKNISAKQAREELILKVIKMQEA